MPRAQILMPEAMRHDPEGWEVQVRHRWTLT
jgi:hypothetical protein